MSSTTMAVWSMPRNRSVCGTVPLRGALVRRERNDLEKVPVGIAEVERADPSGAGIPIGQTLRPGGRVLDAVLPEPCIGPCHVADDDRDVLKRAIVGTDVGRHGPAFRRQKLGQFNLL